MNLTAALLATERPLTADELRGRVEGYPDADASFRRAFERDKDDLRRMGIPITMREVPHSDPPAQGYAVDRAEYAGNDPHLAPDELAALHVAANLVHIGDRPEGALWKIGGVVDNAPGARDTANAQPLVALPTDANLAPLFQAATELRVAQFRYRDLDREVEPLRLSFTAECGDLHLKGAKASSGAVVHWRGRRRGLLDAARRRQGRLRSDDSPDRHGRFRLR